MNKLTLSLTTLALAASFGLASVAPASADQAAATRNTILGIGALIAGIAIESNVAHKNAVANTVEGYTQNGATVYQDGHVVEPDGNAYYPGNVGRQIACNGGSCDVYADNGGGWNRWQR